MTLLAVVVIARPIAATGQTADPPREACRRVARSETRWSDATLKTWVGDYIISVVATQGRYSADSVARGWLSLWLTEPPYAQDSPSPTRPARTYPVSGATNVPLARLSPVSIAIPLTSRDPARPGVQLNSGREMVFGGHWGPGFFTVDAGVLFEIDAANARGLFGHWVEGGRHAIHGQLPAGYFCAVRRRAPATKRVAAVDGRSSDARFARDF